MTLVRWIVLFFSSVFMFSSCVKNNPDPSWLQVNDWTLESNIALSGEEGELTQNMTNAKVFVNDQLGIDYSRRGLQGLDEEVV